jgi:hypothetical protein
MALDSRQKRAGALLGMPWMVITPIADGTIDGADRQMVADVYPGIAAGAPVVVGGEVMYGMMRIIRTVREILLPYGHMYIE